MNRKLPATLGRIIPGYVIQWRCYGHVKYTRGMRGFFFLFFFNGALARCRYLAPSVLVRSRLAVRGERAYGDHLGQPGDVRTLWLADIPGPAGHFYSFSRGRAS